MQDYRYRVFLQHEYAQMFFEAALHPDLEELRRRDRFFEQIAQETPYYDDDGDLITEIPDIDVELLMEVGKQYQQLKDFQCNFSFWFEKETMVSEQSSDYKVGIGQNIAA